MSDGAPPRLRLDKWLWAARFFKTRALATEAVNGGKVHCNGVRGRPGKEVMPGDELRIRRGSEEFTVIIRGLAQRRGPASLAQQLYLETEESEQARTLLNTQRRLLAQQTPHSAGRPNKKERRQLVRLKGKA